MSWFKKYPSTADNGHTLIIVRPEWQEARGERYGNQRKEVARLKQKSRKARRVREKHNINLDE